MQARSLACTLTHYQLVQSSPRCRRSPPPRSSSASLRLACLRWPRQFPARRAAAILAPEASSTFFPCELRSGCHPVQCRGSADTVPSLKRRLVHDYGIQPHQWQSAACAWKPPWQPCLSRLNLCQVRPHSPLARRATTTAATGILTSHHSGPNWIDYLTTTFNTSEVLTYNLAYGPIPPTPFGQLPLTGWCRRSNSRLGPGQAVSR